MLAALRMMQRYPIPTRSLMIHTVVPKGGGGTIAIILRATLLFTPELYHNSTRAIETISESAVEVRHAIHVLAKLIFEVKCQSSSPVQ